MRLGSTTATTFLERTKDCLIFKHDCFVWRYHHSTVLTEKRLEILGCPNSVKYWRGILKRWIYAWLYRLKREKCKEWGRMCVYTQKTGTFLLFEGIAASDGKERRAEVGRAVTLLCKPSGGIQNIFQSMHIYYWMRNTKMLKILRFGNYKMNGNFLPRTYVQSFCLSPSCFPVEVLPASLLGSKGRGEELIMRVAFRSILSSGRTCVKHTQDQPQAQCKLLTFPGTIEPSQQFFYIRRKNENTMLCLVLGQQES